MRIPFTTKLIICNQGSTRSGENNGHVIRLFGTADPVHTEPVITSPMRERGW